MGIEDIKDPIERFVSFINEREAIRQRRNAGWPSKEWTQERILKQYRFTNINRENDKVSQHYQKTVRNRYKEQDIVLPATVLYRWFNRPETCDHFFNQPDFANRSVFDLYIDYGDHSILTDCLSHISTPHVTGAYLIPSKPGFPKGEGVLQYFHQWCKKPWKNMWDQWLHKEPPVTLQEVYEWTKSDGLGTFMRAQIVADLKYLPFLRKAEDWWTFAAPGPGSKKGLNAVYWRSMNATWKDAEWLEWLTKLNSTISPKLDEINITRLHNQDLQNCLCEFSKFEKVRLGIGRPRQVYHAPDADNNPNARKESGPVNSTEST